MKKYKSYQEYKDEAKIRHDSIMAKYGAPSQQNGDPITAKPPPSLNGSPPDSDRQYRQYALLPWHQRQSLSKTIRKSP
jgi:hypothetical protein